MSVDRAKLALSKESCLIELLRTHRSVFVHVDTRRVGVVFPNLLMNQPQLVLELGLNLPAPLPDLDVDENGWSATLSFNRVPSLCVAAWPAVYMIAGDSGVGCRWPTDCPPEAEIRQAKKEDDPINPPDASKVDTRKEPAIQRRKERRRTLPPGWRGVIEGGKN